jgi:hypothetical protein
MAMCDGANPYVVPLNFGYDGESLYFHAAPEGKKLDVLRVNNRVCVEFDADAEIISSEEAVGWSTKYRSAIVFGLASFVENPAEKRLAYDAIMRHYSDKTFEYPDMCVDCSVIIRVAVDSVTGKMSGD